MLGLADELYVVDPDGAARRRCMDLGIASDRVSGTVSDFLDQADLVVILAPTDLHLEVCLPVLKTGKPLFIEYSHFLPIWYTRCTTKEADNRSDNQGEGSRG